MTGTCKFKAKTQYPTISRYYLLFSFYSTLNFLSNGMQYVKVFAVKICSILLKKIHYGNLKK